MGYAGQEGRHQDHPVILEYLERSGLARSFCLDGGEAKGIFTGISFAIWFFHKLPVNPQLAIALPTQLDYNIFAKTGTKQAPRNKFYLEVIHYA